MIDQKAREIADKLHIGYVSPMEDMTREAAARLGIIEGLEMAAKVADEHYMKRGNPDYLPACREIAAVIRALIEDSPP